METLKPVVYAVSWQNDICVLIDQTKLPKYEEYLHCERYEQVVSAIQSLSVRGAPALGVAATYAVVLAYRQSKTLEELKNALHIIATCRPTAVNLSWGVHQLKEEAIQFFPSKEGLNILLEKAKKIHEQDIEANRKMAVLGASLFEPDATVITHCNTGDLATGGIGTALGVIRQLHSEKKLKLAYSCEARPVLQGLRLTAWELKKNKIPFKVICDSMIGSVLNLEKVSGILVGADRITACGDAANKVGTLNLAVLAQYYKVPFYVVAPTTTFDLSLDSGREIPIEERSPQEILRTLSVEDHFFPTFNPSFDVTPSHLITAIICEKGIISYPDKEKVVQTVNHDA